MRRVFLLVALLLPLPLLAQAAVVEEKLDASRIDLAALVECRQGLADFHYLAPALIDPLQAVALGWRPLPQANMFMTEFVLNNPISVFGSDTDHIAFTGDSIIAILDLPDPRPLAKRLELETAIDTPAKAMFGKEVSSVEERNEATGKVYIKSAVLNVSNVSSHPGKTLVGCSYSLDLPEESEAAPEAPPAPSVDAAPR